MFQRILVFRTGCLSCSDWSHIVSQAEHLQQEFPWRSPKLSFVRVYFQFLVCIPPSSAHPGAVVELWGTKKGVDCSEISGHPTWLGWTQQPSVESFTSDFKTCCSSLLVGHRADTSYIWHWLESPPESQQRRQRVRQLDLASGTPVRTLTLLNACSQSLLNRLCPFNWAAQSHHLPPTLSVLNIHLWCRQRIKLWSSFWKRERFSSNCSPYALIYLQD